MTYADAQLAAWRPSASFATPPVHIYGLIDPETCECRYIGKSIRPKERLNNHMQDKSDCHRTHWLRQLKAKGVRPDIVILETIEGAHPWQVSERHWIAYGRAQGWPLTNNTSGGDGVHALPAETRARMRATWIGRKHSAETKRKIGLASSQRRASPELREHMRQVHKGRHITWGAKISAAIQSVSDEQACEIIRRADAGERTIDLAREYGVHRTTISNIKMGHFHWKRLHP